MSTADLATVHDDDLFAEALARDDVAVIWLQLGIHDDEDVARAEAAGRRVVQDRCMKPEHQRLVASA